MEPLFTALWFGLILVTAVKGGAVVRPSSLRTAVAARAVLLGGEPGPADRTAIERRVRTQHRWTAYGGGALLAVSTVLVGAGFGWTWSMAMTFSLVAASAAAVAAGAGVAALRAGRTTGPTSTTGRRADGIADFVPRYERVAARAVPAAALVLIALTTATGAATTPSLIDAALVVGAVLVRELASRRVAAATPAAGPAVDPVLLDAFRAEDLLALAVAPIGVSAFATFAAGWNGGSGAASLAAVAVGVLAAGAAWIASLRLERGTSEHHFLHRRWPDRARRLAAASS